MYRFKKLSAVGLVILLALFLGGCRRNTISQTDQGVQPVETVENDNQTSQPERLANYARYIPYSPSAFAQAADKRRVLFFYTNWCSTCTPADKDFSEYEGLIPEDVVVLRADYDAERALKQRYGIAYQHTLVQVDGDDNQIAIWNGGGIDELLENIQ